MLGSNSGMGVLINTRAAVVVIQRLASNWQVLALSMPRLLLEVIISLSGQNTCVTVECLTMTLRVSGDGWGSILHVWIASIHSIARSIGVE